MSDLADGADGCGVLFAVAVLAAPPLLTAVAVHTAPAQHARSPELWLLLGSLAAWLAVDAMLPLVLEGSAVRRRGDLEPVSRVAMALAAVAIAVLGGTIANSSLLTGPLPKETVGDAALRLAAVDALLIVLASGAAIILRRPPPPIRDGEASNQQKPGQRPSFASGFWSSAEAHVRSTVVLLLGSAVSAGIAGLLYASAVADLGR